MSGCSRSGSTCAPYDDGSLYDDGELYCSDEFSLRSYLTTTDAYFHFLAIRIQSSSGKNFMVEAIKPIVLSQRSNAPAEGSYQVDVDNACPQFLALRVRYSGGADFRVTNIRPILNVKKQRPVL